MTSQTTIVFAAAVAAILAGCSTTPNWDAHFGEPVSIITAQQVIDPGASRNTAPVNGVDGKAAQGAMGEYERSFAKPQTEPTTFTIGVGGKSAK
ncbi:pilus assembly protein [Azoarcus sp. DN11]|uniref:pilus assembly protein n=1 Tax=Azoarcus sp. DN11 TaxID=356837 RepID=UPI000EAEBAFB|nr:pilus assembly protein [Azoarcus sp. DN11]AYH45634.1 pilus assembly protein [Azoarcus sp. DN11]